MANKALSKSTLHSFVGKSWWTKQNLLYKANLRAIYNQKQKLKEMKTFKNYLVAFVLNKASALYLDVSVLDDNPVLRPCELETYRCS